MLDPFTPRLVQRLQQLKIHTRRSFLGSRQGSHISKRRGHGLEFAEFRPYTPGDDFRYIDWGVYGRSDRLYIRQFREEQDLNVSVLLDCSHSMAFPEDGGKFELARNLALALGYIALTDGDTVTFSLLGQKNTPRFVGPRAIRKAIAEVMSVKPQGEFVLLDEVRGALAKQKIPGKCFLLSDFFYETEQVLETFDYLRARNFEVCSLQVLAPSELELTPRTDIVVDSESGEELALALDQSSVKEYAKALAAHIGAMEQYASSSGFPHAVVPSSDTLEQVVFGRLPLLGVLK